MATFKVQGGNKLSGEIIPQGAKNEALQILCAVLLSPAITSTSPFFNIAIHLAKLGDCTKVNSLSNTSASTSSAEI